MRTDAAALILDLIKRRPELRACRETVETASEQIVRCCRAGGTVLACGNGGSAADAEHLVGELMNRFLLKRPADTEVCSRLRSDYKEEGDRIASRLQDTVPAISLVSQVALTTAVANDSSADMVFAQQVYGYGRPGDILVAISTSGKAVNVLNAARVAHARKMQVIGLTGASGGPLKPLCDTAICVPSEITYQIQELHVAVYHSICAAVEQELFGK